METITYERIPHIIERQYAAEQAFLAEFEAGSYTLANPLVKLNPYEFCPLMKRFTFSFNKLLINFNYLSNFFFWQVC